MGRFKARRLRKEIPVCIEEASFKGLEEHVNPDADLWRLARALKFRFRVS